MSLPVSAVRRDKSVVERAKFVQFGRKVVECSLLCHQQCSGASVGEPGGLNQRRPTGITHIQDSTECHGERGDGVAVVVGE